MINARVMNVIATQLEQIHIKKLYINIILNFVISCSVFKFGLHLYFSII